MKIIKQITKQESRALEITGYEVLGNGLFEISEVFVNSDTSQLAIDYVENLETDFKDCAERLKVIQAYESQLETIICMIERLTGLEQAHNLGFTGSDKSFEKLNNTEIKRQ